MSNETDEFVATHDMVKGAMALIETPRAEALYAAMGPGIEISGGSAANTTAGVASLGSTAAYIGRVSNDQLGAVYTHDLRSAGVQFETTPATDGLPTGRSLIIVTPDAERTMNTYLGASSELTADDVDPDLIRAAAYTYLEGYLWDSPAAQDAYRLAAEVAHEAGQQVALTLSDGFVVDRHRDTFLELIAGSVDLLFANDVEIQSLYEVDVRRRDRQGAPSLHDCGDHPWRRRFGVALRRRRHRRFRSNRFRVVWWSTRPARATCTPPA